MNPIQDEFGVTEYKGEPAVSSRFVADIFNRRHDDVLKAIRNCECSENFRLRNFAETSYKDSQGKKQPQITMNKDGFAFVVMGFTGKKAAQFKEAYIERFNQMESFIQSLSAAKLEFPEFTRAIMAAHEEPKHYHFSNEINLINRIALGMDAKRYKESHGIDPEVQSIRPYLNLTEIKAIEALQKFDIGLIVTVPEYEERKKTLTDYYSRLNGLKLLN